jgi:hypothetical protein
MKGAARGRLCGFTIGLRGEVLRVGLRVNWINRLGRLKHGVSPAAAFVRHPTRIIGIYKYSFGGSGSAGRSSDLYSARTNAFSFEACEKLVCNALVLCAWGRILFSRRFRKLIAAYTICCMRSLRHLRLNSFTLRSLLISMPMYSSLTRDARVYLFSQAKYSLPYARYASIAINVILTSQYFT